MYIKYIHAAGACVGTAGWGTVLQAGRSQVWFPIVSLEFFIYIISPSPSNRNEYQDYFLGVKAANAQGWQPYHLMSWNLGNSTSWNPQVLSRPVQRQLYLYLKHVAASGLCCYTFLTHASCIHMLYVLWQQSTLEAWNPALIDFKRVCSNTPPFSPPSKHSAFQYLPSSNKT